MDNIFTNSLLKVLTTYATPPTKYEPLTNIWLPERDTLMLIVVLIIVMSIFLVGRYSASLRKFYALAITKPAIIAPVLSGMVLAMFAIYPIICFKTSDCSLVNDFRGVDSLIR